jgi:hypothetical protein
LVEHEAVLDRKITALYRMAPPERREIDWGTAEIRGSTLTVELTGASSKDWKRRFTGVLGLLEPGSAAWGRVELARRGIAVEQVQEGSEGDLRHHLESVVLEVNSQLGLENEGEPDNRGESHSSSEEDAERSLDERMTATFKAFGATDV